MKSDQFNQLTIEQAKEGFDLCADNSELHFKLADKLGKDKNYAMSCSHYVLAAEEATKALFLYFKYQKNELNIPVQKIFFNHLDKHIFAKANYVFFHETLVTVLSYMDESNKISFTEEYFKQLELEDYPEAQSQRLVIEFFETKYKKIKHLNIKKSLPTINEWFDRANALKNFGLYVDFQNNIWNNRAVITEDNFIQSRFISEILVMLANTLKETGATIRKS